jgi:uncharacterized membrane protein
VHGGATFATTFLASAVEAIEMVAIVVGVGTIRGWRSALVGAAAGLAVVAVAGGALGTALTRIPIHALQILIGTVLLVFGLQWLSKGIRRVARKGLAGDEEEVDASANGETRLGLDWTAFVLSFKGVLLEGLEIAFIVVTFGTTSGHLWVGAIGGASALVLLAAVGLAFHRSLARIPRSLLILLVGLALSTFGTFWAAEGLGVDWPGGDLALPVLVGWFGAVAAAFVARLRQRGPVPA